MAILRRFEVLWRPPMAILDPGKGPNTLPRMCPDLIQPRSTQIHQFEAARPTYGNKRAIYGLFEPFWDPLALSLMVKFTKPGLLIAQTSYLGRFKPLKKFGKSFLKSVKVYRRILDLAHCARFSIECIILCS